MGHKSWKEHYEKKYPGGSVQVLEGSVDVWNQKGEHCVALRKNGHGNMVDVSEEHGCLHSHDLAPLPAKVLPAHIHAEGKVKSCEEIGLHLFDEKQKPIKD